MEKDIDKIRKNDDTEIIIRVDDFGGKRGVTIREFVRGERYTGFTKAGTRIPIEHFSKFKEAINSISEDELMENLPEPQGFNSENKSSGHTADKKSAVPSVGTEGKKEKASSGANDGDSNSDDIQEEAM